MGGDTGHPVSHNAPPQVFASYHLGPTPDVLSRTITRDNHHAASGNPQP